MSATGARRALVVALLVGGLTPGLAAAHALKALWHPARLSPGDVAWLHLPGVPASATVEGSVEGRPLSFFPYAGGQAAVAGFDLDLKPGPQRWRVAVLRAGEEPQTASGQIQLRRRDFPIQRLTLPPAVVDPDLETIRRAEAEGERLRSLYRTITPERLWQGRFVRPVGGTEPGAGFGARRIINGQPRAPHSGLDYALPLGTPVVAANDAVVALVADYFFPGRLLVLDHGLGLYTLYFHLDTVGVVLGERVSRGQQIATVGATGRATGPHLHFGAQIGGARIDPASLLGLTILD